jgi:hypothetical protein
MIIEIDFTHGRRDKVRADELEKFEKGETIELIVITFGVKHECNVLAKSDKIERVVRKCLLASRAYV